MKINDSLFKIHAIMEFKANYSGLHERVNGLEIVCSPRY
jgi:hypothetical protein